MALSTFFSDSKLANQIGGLLLLIPQLIFLWISSKTTNIKYVLYAFYWLPVMPACCLFTSLSLNHDPDFSQYNIVHVEFLNIPLTWAILILNIPFWLMMYQYFDSIMPSDYGISKHPCFCFLKK